MLEKPVIVALYAVSIAVREHPVLKPCYRIGKYKRRELSTRQHIVTDRYFLGAKFVKYTLIHTLIMSAEYYEIILGGKLLYYALRQYFALRRHIDYARRRAAFLLYCSYTVVYRLCLHNHTRAAAVCLVIDTVVLISGIVTDIVTMYIYMTCFSSSADYAFRQVRFAHIGKEGSYINPYHRFSVFILRQTSRQAVL